MGLRSRVNDWTYRGYSRIRHPDAWSAPIHDTEGFRALREHKYAVLVTFRRDGTAIPTPVWFGLDVDGRFYTRTATRTAKVRRIRRNPRVQVFPSNVRGRPMGPAAEGIARILPPEDRARAESAIRDNYGLGRRIYEVLLGEEEAVYLEVSPQ